MYMKKYIYKITSPSNKVYIGKSTIPVTDKIRGYAYCEINGTTNRKIMNAIKKYKWINMQFEVIDENDMWSTEELNTREIYWINLFNSVEVGYNMTIGGDGVDSASAKQFALMHHTNMTDETRQLRIKNCSIGQLRRFKEVPESDLTKQRKSDSHKGVYRIESPDGNVWETSAGLKEFAELHKDEIGISYWKLFSAYRKGYNKTVTTRIRKDTNNWKVTRLDKSTN